MAKNDDEYDDDELAEEEFVDEEADFAEEGPRPRVSMLTVVLCLLNVAATVGFATLLVMDYSKRQEWSYAVFQRDLALMGLPLAQEADDYSGYQQAGAAQRLDPDKIKEAARKRGVSVSERFTPVYEVFPNRIRPQHLTDEALKDHFKGIGSPVRTLEEEIERVQKSLPQDIAAAAKELAAKAPDVKAKRDMLALVLLPLARSPKQIDDVNTLIQKADPTKLEEMLIDAGQRRVLYDILAPLEYFRPSPFKTWPLEQIADIGSKKLEEFTTMLEQRLKAASAGKYHPDLHFGKEWDNKERDSTEKRQVMAFVLCTIAQARKPDGTPLYPQGPERVQKVVGLFEDAMAARTLGIAIDKMTDRLVQLAIEDREGKPVKDNTGKVSTTTGFVHTYAEEIRHIKDIIQEIKSRTFRLADLENQKMQQENILQIREKHLETVTAELIGERKRTAFQLQELQRVQRQLFEAQVKLADAHQTNLRLEQSIRRAEARLRGETP